MKPRDVQLAAEAPRGPKGKGSRGSTGCRRFLCMPGGGRDTYNAKEPALRNGCFACALLGAAQLASSLRVPAKASPRPGGLLLGLSAGMVEERMRNVPGSWDRSPLDPGRFSVSVDCGAYLAWDHFTHRPRPVRTRNMIDLPRLVQALPNIDAAGKLI